MALWAAGLHVGIDRTEIFRASRYPAPPARARAIAVYILTTYLDFHGDDAAVVIGVADRKHVRKLKMRVIDERENDAALDRFLDDIGALIEGRRAA